jgi:hypothetical protein
MYQQPNAPQSIGGVLDSGLKLYRESVFRVFSIAAAASLVAAPLNIAAPYIVTNGLTFERFGMLASGVIVMWIVICFLNGAIIARIDSIARLTPLSLSGALAIGIRRLAAMLVCGIVLTVCGFVLAIPGAMLGAAVVRTLNAGGPAPVASILVFFLAIVVPISIFAVWFVFGPSALIVERLGPLSCLARSFAIVRGRWWRTAVLLTMLGILLLIVYMIFGIVAAIAAFVSGGTTFPQQVPWYYHVFVTPVLSAFGIPMLYALMLAIFYDLRLRHEGGDLAARIAATA